MENVKQFIIESKYMCLGTCDSEGNVWTAPLTYVADDDLNIYFHSALDSIHIEHIRENPNVSFSIYDSNLFLGEIDGLQGKAIVGQLENDAVEKIHANFFEKHIPNSEMRARFAPPSVAFLSDEFPQKRYFKMQITELYKKNLEIINVARRMKIDLEDLVK